MNDAERSFAALRMSSLSTFLKWTSFAQRRPLTLFQPSTFAILRNVLAGDAYVLGAARCAGVVTRVAIEGGGVRMHAEDRDRVVAGTAQERAEPEDAIAARAALENLTDSIPIDQQIATGTAVDGVVARGAEDGVVA